MELQFITLIILLILLAEVTYLAAKAPRHFAVRRQSRPVLLDTSVLIDGRIVAVAKTGFIGGTLIIPRSVLGELQYLADTGDHDKRARARFGLDVVSELQSIPETDVEILQDGTKADEGVDNRLLTLAKKYSAVICTIDYNLNKVAVAEGTIVLNINELAQSLRMAYIPGEKMHLELVQKGQDSHQAVGYLPDGTLVVVEHAKRLIGKTVEVEIIRSLQTAAGRMMFARLVGVENGKQNTPADSAISTKDTNGIQSTKDTAKNKTKAHQGLRNAGAPSNRRGNKPAASGRRSASSRRGPSDIESDLISLVEKS